MNTPSSPTTPIVSRNYADLLTPGVQVELTAEDASDMGLVHDNAMSEADAWASNEDVVEGRV